MLQNTGKHNSNKGTVLVILIFFYFRVELICKIDVILVNLTIVCVIIIHNLPLIVGL